MNTHLIDQVKLTQAITPTAGAAGATAINGATLDMAGWDGVLIWVPFGAIVTNAVTSIKVQHGDASNLADAADVEGTAQTVSDGADDTGFWIDIHRTAKRYIRVVVLRATQNATVGGALYMQYKGRALPPTQGTGVAGGEKHVAPVSGTA